MDATKYKTGYFPVDKKYNKWVDKDHLEKAPIWCSVDIRNGNQIYSFDMKNESDAIEKAVYNVLEDGYRCADIMPSKDTNCKKVGCSEMGRLILEKLGDVSQ